MCFPWSKLNHHHVGLNFLVKSCTKKCTGLTRNLDPYPAITAIKVQISYPHGYWIATNWPEPNYLSVKEFKANPIPHHRFARLKHQCKRCANHWKVRLLERWRRAHPPTEGGAAGAESLVGQGQMSHRSQPESAQRFATRSRWPPVGSITKTIITFVRTFLTTYLSPRSAVLAQHQQSTLQRAPFGHATNRWVGGMWFGLIQHENPSLSGGILNHLPVPNIAWNGGNWGPYWNSVIGCTLPRKLPLEFQTGCHPESSLLEKLPISSAKVQNHRHRHSAQMSHQPSAYKMTRASHLGVASNGCSQKFFGSHKMLGSSEDSKWTKNIKKLRRISFHQRPSQIQIAQFPFPKTPRWAFGNGKVRQGYGRHQKSQPRTRGLR